MHSQVLLQALCVTWGGICPVPASFHGWSTALVAPVVSSVVQVAEFGADFHCRVWDPSGEAESE